jgi:alpha-tubulin suppressor-like RCC1 family protein
MACALRNDGTVWCWGWDISGTLTASPAGTSGARGYARPICASGNGPTCVPLSGVTSLAVGYDHVCAANELGEVWCWGGDDCGELGRGLSLVCDDDAERVSVPQRVRIDGAGTPLTDVAEVSVGRGYTCALKRNGRIVCFGDNRTGALGAEIVGDSARFPVEVCVASGGSCTPVSNFVAVRAGLTHACGIRADGTLACWGADRCGQLGNPLRTSCIGSERTTALVACSEIVAPCVPIEDVIEVGVGDEYTCVLHGTGAVSCWGANGVGEVGLGFFNSGSTAQPFAPVGACDGSCGGSCATPLSGAVSLASKWAHSCAVRDDGVAHCWGLNGVGQVGSDTNSGSIVCSAYPSCAEGNSPACTLNDAGEARVCDVLSVAP